MHQRAAGCAHHLSYTETVKFLEVLAAAFINTFGITQPTDEARRRAAWFILGLLLLMAAVVICVGYAFYAAMHR